jgi:hypothetical protein
MKWGENEIAVNKKENLKQNFYFAKFEVGGTADALFLFK